MRFDEIYTTSIYLYFASNRRVPSFARYRLTSDNLKTKRVCPFVRWMLLNLVAKNKFYTLLYIIICLLMAILLWLQLISVWFDFISIVSYSLKNHIILLQMFVAEKVLLLLVISLTAHHQPVPVSEDDAKFTKPRPMVVSNVSPVLQWDHTSERGSQNAMIPLFL